MKFTVILLALMLTYVSSPAHVPNFDNFTTPVIEPGHTGKFNFTIENRYVATMKNCVLHVTIYMWATEQEAKSIWKIKDPPVIEESGSVNYTINLGDINSKEIIPVEFHIKTFSGTPDGVYFVRFSLFFKYNGTTYKMWSPGYFSKEEWNRATENHTINLNYLSQVLGESVDGIIPDSSFSVKSSLLWILYVLIGITTVVGIAAFYTYLHEEGEIGKKEEYAYQLKGKYRYLERRVKEKMKKKNQ